MKTGSDPEFQSCKLPASVIQMPCTSASGSAILMAGAILMATTSASAILMPCTSASASAILMTRVILIPSTSASANAILMSSAIPS